jgi:hypothetical protein
VYVEAGPNAYLYSAPSTLDGTKTSKLVTGLATTGDYTASVVTRDAAGNNGPTTSVLIRATSVAITRTVSTVTYGGTSTLNAKLTMVTGGAVLKSGSIIFYSRKKGVGSYVAVVTKPINAATGLASYVVKPSTNTEYLARYNGGTNLFGRTSGVTNVLVKPKIVSKITNTSGATITSSRYGSYVYFKATVSPNHKAQYVYLQRYTSAGWKNVVRVTLSTYSAISYRYRLLAKGTFKYRIYKGADSDHVVTTGATLTLKVT